MKIWIPVVIIIGALGTLIGFSVYSMGYPEVQVAELITTEGEDFSGRLVKLQGRIAAIHSETGTIHFDVSDKADPTKIVTVKVDGLRPELFKVGNDVAVDGVFDRAQGEMNGTKIYTKCPSKYEASKGEGMGYDGTGYDQPAAPSAAVDAVDEEVGKEVQEAAPE